MKYRTKLVIGLLAVFLMLMIPNVSAVEYQSLDNEIEQMKEQIVGSLGNIVNFVKCIILSIFIGVIGQLFEFYFHIPILAILCYCIQGYLLSDGLYPLISETPLLVGLIIDMILVTIVVCLGGIIADAIIEKLPEGIIA